MAKIIKVFVDVESIIPKIHKYQEKQKTNN